MNERKYYYNVCAGRTYDPVICAFPSCICVLLSITYIHPHPRGAQLCLFRVETQCEEADARLLRDRCTSRTLRGAMKFKWVATLADQVDLLWRHHKWMNDMVDGYAREPFFSALIEKLKSIASTLSVKSAIHAHDCFFAVCNVNNVQSVSFPPHGLNYVCR